MHGQENIKECELKFCSETLKDLESWEDIMTDFFPPNATTCPLWTSWSPLPFVAEV
jgi:hypothetical protein